MRSFFKKNDPIAQPLDGRFDSLISTEEARLSDSQNASLTTYTTKFWRASPSKYLLDWLSTFEDQVSLDQENGELNLSLVFNKAIWGQKNIDMNPDSNILFHLCKLAEKVNNDSDLSQQQKCEVVSGIAKVLDEVLAKSDLVLSQEELMDLFQDDGQSSKVIDYCSTMVDSTIYETILRDIL